MSWAWWELCAKGAIRKSVYTGKNQGGTCRLDLEGPWSRWLEYSRVKRMGRSVRMWDSTPGDDANLLGGWLWKPGKQYGPTEWSWKAECLQQVVEEGTKSSAKQPMLERMEDYVLSQGPEDSVLTRLLWICQWKRRLRHQLCSAGWPGACSLRAVGCQSPRATDPRCWH